MKNWMAKVTKRKLLLSLVSFGFILGLVAIYHSVRVNARHDSKLLHLHGWVEGTNVTLSSKAKGQIIKLNAEEGLEVKQGQLVAVIDSEQIKAQIANAAAEIARAQEGVKKAGNAVKVQESRLVGEKIALKLAKEQSDSLIAKAKAELNKAQKDDKRTASLVEKNLIPLAKMDEVREAYNVAMANMALSKSSQIDILLKENNVTTLERELATEKMNEEMAKSVLNGAIARKREIVASMDDTIIYSPVAGTVTDKPIELGENVVPGTPLAVIVDLTKLYIKAYVEQKDIGKVKLGGEAQIHVDSFPNRNFKGKVIYISPKVEFTPRDVQMNEHRATMVYKIKVGIDNPQGILKPGIPADVDIRWDK